MQGNKFLELPYRVNNLVAIGEFQHENLLSSGINRHPYLSHHTSFQPINLNIFFLSP